MLGEKIREIRKGRGLTQEELAIRLHVVRQTVSKWEKNLSVPDAELLQRLSEELETPVSELLGAELPREENRNQIAEQLARISELLAVRNRRTKKIWTAVAVVLALAVLLPLMATVLGMVSYTGGRESITTSVSVSEENPLYDRRDVEEAMDAVIEIYKKVYHGCTELSLTYEEESGREDAEYWSGRYPDAEFLVLRGSYSTGDRPPQGLTPNESFRDCRWVLSRKEGSWTVLVWGAAAPANTNQ